MDAYEIQNFSEVWTRVTSDIETHEKPESAILAGLATKCVTPAPARSSSCKDAETLCRFIADEVNDCRYYAALAVRFGRNGAAFRQISEDEACHARRLRAAYFILTGKTCEPECKNPCIISLSDALRERYLEEVSGAAAYCDAANATGNERLACLYEQIAEDEKRHACTLEGLIERMMC